MNYIGQAIQEAVGKGGYRTGGMEISGVSTLAGNPRAVVFEIPSHGIQKYRLTIPHAEVFLDPLFWQALSKARGWKGVWQITFFKEDGTPSPQLYFDGAAEITGTDTSTGEKTTHQIARTAEKISNEAWRYNWHRFIDHLAEGKDVETFFQAL